MINGIEARLTRICQQYAANSHYLAILRMVYGLWIIAMPVEVLWIRDLPAEFFHPRPGFFFFLSEPPVDGVLVGLMVAQYVLGAALALGICTLPTSLALSATLIISSGLCYSFSKVDHMILFEIAPVFLALAGWGSKWSVDAAFLKNRKALVPDSGLPVLLYAMTISWGILTAALPKVKGGWLHPDREATRGYLAREIFRGDRVGPLGGTLNNLDTGIFWKFLDYATLVVEAGVILVVFFPLIFRLWLLLLGAFHIGVYVTLGISFLDYTMVYAVFFSPFFVFVARRLTRSREQAGRDASAVTASPGPPSLGDATE